MFDNSSKTMADTFTQNEARVAVQSGTARRKVNRAIERAAVKAGRPRARYLETLRRGLKPSAREQSALNLIADEAGLAAGH
jgi:hypothetical protein